MSGLAQTCFVQSYDGDARVLIAGGNHYSRRAEPKDQSVADCDAQ
ncbi:conserved hypothetical protein [Vibrio chagasii]|nr:conserved hypothetical protein [Vibrio chagasii]CAH6945951.1 conserved hypothetical protein [Vibrio chagasii]CAH6967019.1 conserved hypothetical protein [Vibrio chagasii]CAH7067580.1 conserved hypothetical protein [Vibrio chagasii]CAH7220102.1 conserved hypothetical protein [Vibrio chagasii]